MPNSGYAGSYSNSIVTLFLEKIGVGRDKLGIWNYKMHTAIYKINNKDILYSTGNYIQYLVITNNRKESEK